jgi:hypothetical protein
MFENCNVYVWCWARFSSFERLTPLRTSGVVLTGLVYLHKSRTECRSDVQYLLVRFGTYDVLYLYVVVRRRTTLSTKFMNVSKKKGGMEMEKEEGRLTRN